MRQTKESKYANKHEDADGLVGYFQSNQDLSINGPLSVTNLEVEVTFQTSDSKDLTSGIFIENGSLTLNSNEKTNLSVSNIKHTQEYRDFSQASRTPRSDVFGINVSNALLQGFNAITANNISSNSIKDSNAAGASGPSGSVLGINLNNLQSTDVIDISASNISNTYSHSMNRAYAAPVIGVSLRGKETELKGVKVSASTLKTTSGDITGIYLRDLDATKTDFDSLTVTGVSKSSYHDGKDIIGLHIDAGSKKDSSTDVKVNDAISVTGLNYTGRDANVPITGIQIGNYNPSYYGSASLTAQDILVRNIQSTGYGELIGFKGYSDRQNINVDAHSLTINNIKTSSQETGKSLEAYGIDLNNTKLEIDEISVNGIYSKSSYGIKLTGESSINSTKIELSSIEGNKESYGLSIENNGSNIISVTTDALSISDLSGNDTNGIRSEYGSITVNDSTYIDVSEGDALYAENDTDIKFNGTNAFLRGDVSLKTGLLQINAADSSIEGAVKIASSGKFTSKADGNSRGNQAPLRITNLRGTNPYNLPQLYPSGGDEGNRSYYWVNLETGKQLRSLDALSVGDGTNFFIGPNGEGALSDELYSLVDLDRSVTIAVQDNPQYHVNSTTEQEITFGAAIRANAGGRVLLDDKNSDYRIIGDIIAGSGSASLGNPEFTEDILNQYFQQGYTLQGGEINLGGRNLTVVGDIFAGNGGKVAVTMNGTSSFEGQVDDYHELNDIKSGQVFHNSAFLGYEQNFETPVYTAGNISITMNDNSNWTARGQSFLSSLSFGDGFNGLVDLSQDGASSITVANLSGNGRFKLHLDSSEPSKSDMLYVTDSMTGSHELIITGNVDVNEISEDDPLRFATINTSLSSAATFKARSVDLGFFNNQYTIAAESFKQGDEDNAAYNGADDGKGVYKPGNDMVEQIFDEDSQNLIITGVEEYNPDNPGTSDNPGTQISDAGRTVIAMSRANYANAVYMDTLNKRLGEARYGVGQDNGVWVRMRHDNIGKEDAFRSHNTMVELGYDFRLALNESELRYGAVLDYMNGQNEYHSVSGDGDLQRYGAWIYGTWLADDGQYADLVLKYGHLKNDFDVFAPYAGEHITADYSNDVISASAEYGWKFANAAGWYVEPQAQLQYSYVTSADYTTSQGTKVDLDAIDSLIGRVGFRAGKDFAAENPITAYIRGDVLHEFLGDQDIAARDNTGVFNETFENDDTWYNVGVGLSVMTSANTYFFIEGEQSFGADNEDTYTVSGGFKHSF